MDETGQLIRKVNYGVKFNDLHGLPILNMRECKKLGLKNGLEKSMSPTGGIFNWCKISECHTRIPWGRGYCERCYDRYFIAVPCANKICSKKIFKYYNQKFCEECSRQCPCGILLLKDQIYQCKTQTLKKRRDFNTNCNFYNRCVERNKFCDTNEYCKKCSNFFMINQGKSNDYMCKNCALQPQTRKEKKKSENLKLKIIPKLGSIFPMLPGDISWIIYKYI